MITSESQVLCRSLFLQWLDEAEDDDEDDDDE